MACLAGTLDLKTEKVNAHSRDINSVAFSPDGTKIVSGSDDKTIKVWDSGTPEALKIASPWPKLINLVRPYLLSVPERDRINYHRLRGPQRRLLAKWD